MAAAKGAEGDYMAVALFCLVQARQAIALAEWSADLGDAWHGLNEFDRVEFHVLKLDHVYESCCQLDGEGPSGFTCPARHAAKAFIRRWKGPNGEELCEACANIEGHGGRMRELQSLCAVCREGERLCRSCQKRMCTAHARHRFGKDLRNALAHYEEVLADRSHRHRGEPDRYMTIRGLDTPSWIRGQVWDLRKGPRGLSLMGKAYQLRGVHEALVQLEREFSAVLLEPGHPWKLRPDA